MIVFLNKPSRRLTISHVLNEALRHDTELNLYREIPAVRMNFTNIFIFHSYGLMQVKMLCSLDVTRNVPGYDVIAFQQTN
nr:unnamed protein product [Callosobruchus chinensis]